MTHSVQPRAALFARCTAALAILSLSFTTVAQTASLPTPEPLPKKPADTASATPGKRQTQAAEDAYLAGARLLDHKDASGAETQFSKALKLNPTNPDYATAAALAREYRVTELVQQSGKARILGQNDKAEALLAEARQLDPQNNLI